MALLSQPKSKSQPLNKRGLDALPHFSYHVDVNEIILINLIILNLYKNLSCCIM